MAVALSGFRALGFVSVFLDARVGLGVVGLVGSAYKSTTRNQHCAIREDGPDDRGGDVQHVSDV